jgi:hypothetical protein
VSISGSLTITPSHVSFKGTKCLLTWLSSGAEHVTITGLGICRPNGEEYVYPARGSSVFTAVFTDYTSTVESTVNVVIDGDPVDQVVDTPLSMIIVKVARNIDAGRVSVNGRTVGTPSYIISSRVRPRVYIEPISDDNVGVI